MMKKPIRKKTWIEDNYVKVIVGLGFLVLFLSFRGCIVSSSHSREIKKITAKYETQITTKDSIINELNTLVTIAQDEIKNLGYELKIAGIKVDAATERADAIQKTAEKIKQNTTIEIKSNEK